MDGYFRQTTKRTLKKQKITTAPLDPSQSSLARTRRRRPTPPEKKPSAPRTGGAPSHTGFVGVTVAKAISEHTSTGDTPQLLRFLDRTTPSTTTFAEGKPGQIQPPNIRSTRSHRCTLETKEGQQPPHQAERETHRPQAPKRISPTSPVKLEQSRTGARKKLGDFIPLCRHRHRLADAARNTMPQRTTPGET